MATIYASVDGRPTIVDGRPTATYTLGVAVNRALPGDTVQLLAGRYTVPIVVRDSGADGLPITIRGGQGVVLDGERRPVDALGSGMTPSDDDFAFIQLQSSDWIVLERLAFENCWPCCVFGRGCRDVVIRDCSALRGRFVVFVRNRWLGRRARRITLERVSWLQDPEQRMWRGEISWGDVKGQTGVDHSYLNGALFSSWDIPGEVVIRDCRVSHAFNAVRLDCAPDGSGARNTDVQIHGNHFDHIRDNAIEPETHALNWWIWHNEIHNCHAPFSLHDVSGGYWYVFGNRFWSTGRPGLPGQGNRGGKVFKFRHEGPVPDQPFLVAHNSFAIRSAYIKDGRTARLRHVNNAIEFFQDPVDGWPGFFRGGPDEYFAWDDSYAFGPDVSNHPDFPASIAECHPVRGLQAARLFREPWRGDLRLRAGSAAAGVSERLVWPMPDGSTVEVGGGQDLGAHQGDGLWAGPVFRAYGRDDQRA